MKNSKKIFIILCILFYSLFNSLLAQDFYQGLYLKIDEYGLKGKVSQITEFYYRDGEKHSDYTQKFNKNGYLELYTWYSLYDIPYRTVKLVYNTDNTLNEIINYFNDTINWRTKYEYKDGLLSQMFYYQDTTQDYKILFYDNKKRLIKSEVYVKNNAGEYVISSYYTYKFDKNGNLLELTEYFDNGNIYSQNKYKYNSKGQKIFEDLKTENLTYQTTIYYKYDKKGYLLEKSYSPQFYTDGKKPESCFVYKYDQNNNVVEVTNYTKDNDIVSPYKIIYTYQYDKYGNWIKKIETYPEGIEKVYERQIIYYD